MRATVMTLLLTGVAASGIRGQAKDTVYDLADISDKPALISRPNLGYKDCYKDAGLTGTDVVKFVIDTAGHVDPASVGLTQVSDPILDSLAVRAIRAMVFHPGLMAGAPVRISAGLPVHFGSGAPPAGDVVFDESCVDKKAQPLGDAGSPGAATGTVRTADTAIASTGRAMEPRRGVTTPIQMRVQVNELGQVSDATVKDASAPADLAQSAVLAARSMRFRPATIDGNPVASWITVRVPVSR